MRILHVLDHGPPMQSGYALRTRALMAAQRALGWEVRGVTGARHVADGPDPEAVDGLLFHRSPRVPPGRGLLGQWRELRGFSDAVGRAARAWKPDIVHAHSPVLGALAAQPVARKLGVPFVYEVRAFWEDLVVAGGAGQEGDARYRLSRAIETRSAEGAAGVVVTCETMRGDLVRRGIPRGKIALVPDGVDERLLGRPKPRDAMLASAMGLRPDDEVVGYIGSFHRFEGVDLLIEAMPALVARRPKLSLVLVGGGADEAVLRAKAAASPARARIHFTGLVPHREVDQLYGLMDVLAYPRRRTPLTELVAPAKPLEAMAEGKLVAASDVGGHRELVRDGETGTLFAPDSLDAIAEAVAGLFADRKSWTKRRDAARRFAAGRNWSSNVRGYQALYERVLGRAR